VFRSIDRKRRFLYKPKRGRTPHHTTLPKETSLGEQLSISCFFISFVHFWIINS
jgi:hypothetical protein